MITGNMNIWDILAVYDRHSKRIGLFAVEKMEKLARELRKGLGKKAVKCYDLTTPDKTEFKVVVEVTRGGHGNYVALAYCRETNLYYRCERNRDYRLRWFNRVYTVHFLHRYAQRIIGQENLNVNTTLAKMLTVETDLALVYREGNDGVYATTFGLVFVHKDEATDGMVFRTVVSIEMLRTSQVKVYRVLGGLLREMANDEAMRDRAEYGGTDFLIEEIARRGVDYGDLYREYRSYFDRKRKKKQGHGRTIGWNDVVKLASADIHRRS